MKFKLFIHQLYAIIYSAYKDDFNRWFSVDRYQLPSIKNNSFDYLLLNVIELLELNLK